MQVFGGLVWTLVASTRVVEANPLGWVMFVSIFCFVMTTIWFFIFLTGKNQSSVWPGLVRDFISWYTFFLLFECRNLKGLGYMNIFYKCILCALSGWTFFLLFTSGCWISCHRCIILS